MRVSSKVGRWLSLGMLASLVTASGGAASDASCERYVLHDLSPGMSHDLVRRKMGGDGVRTLIRTPERGEISGVDYPGPSSDVYVEFDHRVDRRPLARAVLVRVPLPLSPESTQALVDRFGPPHAGAEELDDGLYRGPAVWVDEVCGVVLTAYRSPGSWWAADGGPMLQVESLNLALRGGSPASTQLRAILTNAPAEAAVDSGEIETASPTRLLAEIVTESPIVADDAPVEAVRDAPEALAIPTPPEPEAVAVVTPPSAVGSPVARSIATWHAEAGTTGTPKTLTNRPVPSTHDAPPERVVAVPPVCPPTAKWLNLKGHVTLAIVVKVDGTVADRPRAVAARPAGRGFEEAAIDAVRKWRFNPAIRGGKPVEASLTIGVDIE